MTVNQPFTTTNHNVYTRFVSFPKCAETVKTLFILALFLQKIQFLAMNILAILLSAFLSCFSSVLIYAEKVLEKENVSDLKCLAEVDGRSIPGFKGSKEMPWKELPCNDAGINYCGRLLYKTDREVCITKCCRIITTPMPAPENSKVSSGKVDGGADKKTTEFVTQVSLIKTNYGENKKSKGRPFRFNKNDSENTLLYAFLVILLMAVIICGIFMIRYKRRNAKLERKIRRPIAQPYDAVETMV